MAVPKGIITGWNDIIENIPSGWGLCNGTNDTPDLREFFVFGALDDAAVETTGGALTHTHTSINLDSSGEHTHTVSGTTNASSGTSALASTSGASSVSPDHSHSFSGTTDSQGTHSHTVGTSNSSSGLPPYEMLFFIMKL